MATDKFYVVTNNIVNNIIVCTEEYASKNNLIRYPVRTQFGMVDINWTYINGDFLPPPVDPLAKWNEIRQKRNLLLMESDQLVFPDIWATYTAEKQQAIAHYRQALRDIPQNFDNSNDVVWPQKPE